MKRFKAVIAFVTAAVLMLSFSGCSLRFSSFDALLRPPKVSGKYQALSDAFEKAVDKDYILCTPENGDYQSAFITYDCDSDGDEDAIVFYTERKLSIAKLMYFRYDNGEWILAGSFDGAGESIDNVIFHDVNKDNMQEIIVGWNLLSGKTNKSFSTFAVKEGRLTLIETNPYTYISVLDGNGDGIDDIFTLTIDTSVPEHFTGYARLYNFNALTSRLDILGEARTDGNISAYTSVKQETVDNIKYIYVEALKGENDSITELLYWDDENNCLLSPLFDVESQTTKATWRNMQISCMDVDNDGLLEIPTSYEMKGSETVLNTAKESLPVVNDNFSSTALYYIKWVKFVNGKLKPVQYSVVNDKIGFMLLVQSSWVGRITAIKSDNQLDFYRWSNDKRGDLLFSICSYDSTNEESVEMYSTYKPLTVSGNMRFVYQITDAGYRFGVKEKSLETEFILTDFGG